MTRYSRAALILAVVVLALVTGMAGIAGAAGTRWGIPKGEMGSGYRAGSHNGEDVFQSKGTVIRALHRGCVFRVDNTVQGYEHEITVRYEAKGSMRPRWVLYGHILRGSQRKEGACFRRGDVLARVGDREDALGTPPHAHVQVWKNKSDATYYRNSEAIDPAPIRQKYGEI